METLLVKIFATALALSQVAMAPEAVSTHFDRVADQASVLALTEDSQIAKRVRVCEHEDAGMHRAVS